MTHAESMKMDGMIIELGRELAKIYPKIKAWLVGPANSSNKVLELTNSDMIQKIMFSNDEFELYLNCSTFSDYKSIIFNRAIEEIETFGVFTNDPIPGYNFSKVIEKQLQRCKDVLIKKSAEYATEDRLHNFRTAAEIQKCTMEQAHCKYL